MKKVIFLDIDGVLNNDETFQQAPEKYAAGIALELAFINPELCSKVRRLVKETDAKIVLSSTWRIKQHVCQILATFGLVVFNKTPCRFSYQPRGQEIGMWLRKNQVDTFVILDDENDMGNYMSHLVQTNEATGITDKDVEKAIEILNRE